MPKVTVTVDMIVGAGLVLTLLISVVVGGADGSTQQNLASGLVGFLGRAALEHNHNKEVR